MKKLIFAILLTINISILISCGDQYDFSTKNLSTYIQQKSEIALPLVDASITLDEIFPNDSSTNWFLLIDKNNFLSLQYEFELAQYPATSYFKGNYSGPSLPYLASSITPLTATIGLDKFITQGQIFFADPRITITIKNYWNIPTHFQFTNFFYYKKANSAGLPFTGSICTDWINVNPPVSPSKFAITTILMNNSNTNITDVFSAMPHHITIGANYETIPGGAFNVNPSSVDSVKVKVEIPLDLRGTDVMLKDTIDFNLVKDLGKDTASVESLQLNLIVANGFPISVNTQIYFVDENYKKLDSISASGITIPSAIVAAGLVTGNGTAPIDPIKIENQKKANLFKAKYLIAKVILNTANASASETVKLFSNYAIGLKVGALVKLHLHT
jgi:hypothetical protein